MICRHCDTDVARDDLCGHLVEVHHVRVCVLCARRNRASEVDSAHVCAVCIVRMDDGGVVTSDDLKRDDDFVAKAAR